MQVSSRLPRPLPLTSKNDWGQVRHDLVIVRNTGSDMFTLFPLYFPVHVFFFLSFSQFLKVRISRKNIAYWILSKGRWHLSRFPPCVGWMELLSLRPLNSIKVWLFHNSTKQVCVSSGTQKQRAAPVNLLSQGSVHIWCPSTGAWAVAKNSVSLRHWVLHLDINLSLFVCIGPEKPRWEVAN